MNFPDLTITEKELLENKEAEELLLSRLGFLFRECYGLSPPLKISGSTEKGTVLPKRYFGIDIDSSVLADNTLVDRIAYRSNLFEGCQIFSIDFFDKFRTVFPDSYFAGHRLSGTVNGIPFDFSITDENKDRWKWDYNRSKYLVLTQSQIEEVKKAKFFLKTFNVYGSEVCGIVGPAIELAIYFLDNSEELVKKLKQVRPITSKGISSGFRTITFPEQFYELFGREDNTVYRGLIESFRYTVPNTLNRIVEVAHLGSLELKEFLEGHRPRLNYRRLLKSGNDRLVMHFLATASEETFRQTSDVQLLREGKNVILCASVEGDPSKSSLESLCRDIERVSVQGEIAPSHIDRRVRRDIESALMFGRDYVVFVGQPRFPLDRTKTYIPFDILIRSDADKLIRLIEGGQCGTR